MDSPVETPESPVPEPKQVKTRKKREMTPELLEKLKLARERAAELRAIAKETKSKLPEHIPEKERTKVAQYLATRKAIKATIKNEIINELNTEHPVDSKGYMLPVPKEAPPPMPERSEPIPVPQRVKKNPEPESDSEDEYTTIKIPKKKLVKWKKYEERIIPEPPKSNQNQRVQFNPYTTQHLIGLAMNGYSF